MSGRDLLRWIAVLPTGLLAGIMILFFIRFILAIVFGVDSPLSELIEQLVSPFSFAWAFVAFGSLVAPRHNSWVAYVLAVIWILLAFFLFYSVLVGGSDILYNELGGKYVELRGYGLAFLGGIAGAAYGAWYVKKDHVED